MFLKKRSRGRRTGALKKRSRIGKRRMSGGFMAKKIGTDGINDEWQLCQNGCCKSMFFTSNMSPPSNLDQLLSDNIARALENEYDVCFK